SRSAPPPGIASSGTFPPEAARVFRPVLCERSRLSANRKCLRPRRRTRYRKTSRPLLCAHAEAQDRSWRKASFNFEIGNLIPPPGSGGILVTRIFGRVIANFASKDDALELRRENNGRRAAIGREPMRIR